MHYSLEISDCNEDSLFLQLLENGQTAEPCPTLTQHIRRLTYVLLQYKAYDLEVIPSYNSLLVQFNLLTTDLDHLTKQIKESFEAITSHSNNSFDTHENQYDSDPNETIVIPVYYGQEVGLDLECLAQHHNITSQQVIEIHQGKPYLIYAIGFAPNFAFMGFVDNKIETTRKATPRHKVSAGSVGIAGQQTGIYPSDSPGGWNIIGRTTPSFLNHLHLNPRIFSVGCTVVFQSISRKEYQQQGGKL